MANYLGMRIAGGYLDYIEVTNKYPQFKDGIDVYLKKYNKENLIKQVKDLQE